MMEANNSNGIPHEKELTEDNNIPTGSSVISDKSVASGKVIENNTI
jgi:hypothetical protein